MRVLAISDAREKDVDVLMLHCEKSPPPPSCLNEAPFVSTVCQGMPTNACPDNPAGGPNELDMTVGDSDTDLDSGWSGTFHNVRIPGGWRFKLCLSQCDSSSNSLCTACGPTGLGSLNTETFGPPFPVVAATLPLCVVNRFAPAGSGFIAGTADVQTGAVDITVGLLSDTYVTNLGQVCPRCLGEKCQGGRTTARPARSTGP